MKDPNIIYSAAWFQKDFYSDPRIKQDFFLIADAIYRQYHPAWVVDYGCGPGMILERLFALRVDVRGLEGSLHGIEAASPAIKGYISWADLTTVASGAAPAPFDPLGVVICTEVAEHIEAKHADHLVDLLSAHMCPIVFTAAPPGQGGHDHVNEQAPEYWIAKFAARGCVLDTGATYELKHRWECCIQVLHHMHRNLMVFK